MIEFYDPSSGNLITISGIVFSGIEGIDCQVPNGEFQSRTYDGDGSELNNTKYINKYFAESNRSINRKLTEFETEYTTIKITGLDGNEYITAHGETQTEPPAGSGNAAVYAFCPGFEEWYELDNCAGKSMKLDVNGGITYIGLSVKLIRNTDNPIINFLIY